MEGSLASLMHKTQAAGGILEKGLIGLAILFVLIGALVFVSGKFKSGLTVLFTGFIFGGAWYFYIKTTT